ncbi:MAG: Rrf2 family transcriptional regulator [Acidobacteria bacterium]|nr:Rrf2 family transcriptional regulator [Acidobacteriota bacterium]MCL5288333.1 Rrf2 family transcriptional regulator [Acidobacteriota bacterium]
MKISAKGEYAAKAVLYLSLRYPNVVTIQEVAAQHRIPTKYLEHILLSLKQAGVLESRRGVKGGYRLAKSPAHVTMGEVLSVVDGKFSQSSCSEVRPKGGYACPESDSCGLKQVWQDVQNAVDKILFETTFDDLRKRTLGGLARSPQSAANEL